MRKLTAGEILVADWLESGNSDWDLMIAGIDKSVAAEREACGEVADNYGAPEIAAIIRARGTE